MQRAQPDDDARHAGHRPDPLIRAARRETQPAIYSCTKAVAELLDSYLERLLAPAGRNAVALAGLRLDLAAIAGRELGESLTPGWLTRAQVLDALRERSAEVPEQRLATLGESRLLEADTRNTELMRIALDPIAEHLVARARTEALAGDAEGWRAFLAELRRQGCPAGFIDAVRACLEHRVHGRPVPQEIRRQLLGADPCQMTAE